MNKKHYPATARYLHTTRLVMAAHNHGAKVHFNWFINEDEQLIRYGVVTQAALLRDLTLWESLVASTFLQRPFSVKIENDEVMEANR